MVGTEGPQIHVASPKLSERNLKQHDSHHLNVFPAVSIFAFGLNTEILGALVFDSTTGVIYFALFPSPGDIIFGIRDRAYTSTRT